MSETAAAAAANAAEASLDDVQFSRDGMRLLLCNDWKAAEDLFDKYKYVIVYPN